MSETELEDNVYLHYVSFGDVFLLLNITEVDGTCGAQKTKQKKRIFFPYHWTRASSYGWKAS